MSTTGGMGSAFKNLALAANPQEQENVDQEKSRFRKIIDFLNRGTAGSASFFDELIFDETDTSPVEAFLDATVKGDPKIESYTQILDKFGWKPETAGGKFLRGAAGFALDVGLDPVTYLSLAAGPSVKGLSTVGRLTKAAGKGARSADEAARLTDQALRTLRGGQSRQVRDAAEAVMSARASSDEGLKAIAEKVIQGKNITKTEEAKLGLRHAVALQGLFGGPAAKLVPKGASVQVYQRAGQMFDFLEKNPISSPVINGFGKAFNQWYTLKKKFPDVFKARRQMRARVEAAETDAFVRAMHVMDLVASPDERKLIADIIERPGRTVTVGHEVREIEQVIKRFPDLWIDLGYKPGQPLDEKQSIELVNHFITQMDEWIDEFGADGLFRGPRMLKMKQEQEQIIQDLNKQIRPIANQLPIFRKIRDIQAKSEPNPEDLRYVAEQMSKGVLEPAQLKEIDAIVQRGEVALHSLNEQLEKASRKVTNLDKQLIPAGANQTLEQALQKAADQTIGRGLFGEVKGRWDLVKFQNWVIKLPRSLQQGSQHFSFRGQNRYENIVDEQEVYDILGGIPGIGTSRLIFKEIPVKGVKNPRTGRMQYAIPGFTFDARKTGKDIRALGGDELDLVEKGFADGDRLLQDLDPRQIITKTNGEKVAKIPFLVKNMVDEDKAATRALHAGQVSHDVMRKLEKMLGRVSRKGVVLEDMHYDNLIMGKDGHPYAVDIGVVRNIGTSDKDLFNAWYGNLKYIQDHWRNLVHDVHDKQSFYDNMGNAINAYQKGQIDQGDKLFQAADDILRKYNYTMSGMRYNAIMAPRTQGLDDALVIRKLMKRGFSEDAAKRIVKKHGAKEARQVLAKVPLVTEGQFKIADKAVNDAEVQLQRMIASKDEVMAQMDDLTGAEAQKVSALADERIKEASDELEAAIDKVDALRNLARAGEDEVKVFTRKVNVEVPLKTKLSQGFEKKFGIKHLRHFKKGQDNLAKRFQDGLNRVLKEGVKARKIEGALKEINDNFGREFFETDIAKIMFAAHVETFRIAESWTYLQRIADNYGRPAEKVFRTVVRNGKKIRVPRYRPTDDAHTMIDHPLFDGLEVPKELIEATQDLVTKVRQEPTQKLAQRWFDGAQNWWKKWALFAYPSYHLRNIVGALWNNFLADVPFRSHDEAYDIIIGASNIGRHWKDFKGGTPFQWAGIKAVKPNKKVRGLDMTRQEILDEARHNGVLGRGLFGASGDIERQTWERFTALSKNPLQLLNPSASKNTLVRFGMKVGEQIENSVRLAHYMAKRRAGFSAEDAAMSVKKFQFDYADLSDFEKGFLKRIFPFYAWTRNNVPLQVEHALLRPGKLASAGKAVNQIQLSAGGEPPASAIIPKWLHENLGVRFHFNKETGTYEYWLLGSWLPAADLMRMFHPAETAKDMLSPLIKAPAEQLFNESLFFERPLEEFPGQPVNLLSPGAGKVLQDLLPMPEGVSDAATQLLEKTIGRPLGAIPAPLSQGVSARGRAVSAARQLRPVNEARRFLETSAREGVKFGLLTSFFGKSYGFDPAQQKEYLVYAKRREIGVLKAEMRKALRHGQQEKALGIARKIRALEQDVNSIQAAVVPPHGG
jgi:hypothetical protein